MLIRPPATPLPRNRLSRGGFSFTEILFAVMILGIGFIMVVAIFPVALQQTENSQAETVGAAVAKAGVNFVSQNASTSFIDQTNTSPPGQTLVPFSILRPTIGNFFTNTVDDYFVYKNTVLKSIAVPPPANPEIIGDVWSFDTQAGNDFAAAVNSTPISGPQPLRNILWPLMSQNMIQSADPRYAWVAFYRRNMVVASNPTTGQYSYSYSPSAQLIVIALKSQAKQFYDQSDLLLGGSTGNFPQSIQPSLGAATIIAPGSNSLSFTIQFSDKTLIQRAAEGAFVIISTDQLNPLTSNAGLLNGHIYRLGTSISADTWEFSPGYGPAPIGTIEGNFASGRQFQVYMVGKALDPNDTSNSTYAGVAQDVTAYSTFISCPTN